MEKMLVSFLIVLFVCLQKHQQASAGIELAVSGTPLQLIQRGAHTNSVSQNKLNKKLNLP